MCKKVSWLTAEVVADSLSEFLSLSRFDNGSLAVNPLRVEVVEPGAFGGQPTRDDVHATFARLNPLQHSLIVLAQPSFDLLTHMLGRGNQSKQALNCPFVRYNPHTEECNIGDVIYRIMLLVSVDGRKNYGESIA